VIPLTMLVLAESFGEQLDATVVATTIGRGLCVGNPSLELDLCPLEEPGTGGDGAAGELRAHLEALRFDVRMHRARAVVIATQRLDNDTLRPGSVVFEVATRARQGGVPAYAVAGRNELDAFATRILDLQVVLEAAGRRELGAAGKKLAGVV
jgi:glycerate kinase